MLHEAVKQLYTRQLGRAVGDDIVQEGTADDGAATRWSFTEITPDGFRWTGERSLDGEVTWQLQADFHAGRIGT